MSRPLLERTAPAPLTDRFGRVHTDLRVSLTDRCNLRCAYCMPAEGLDWLPRPELLTDDEVVRLVRIAVGRLGITEVRLTGGEPLLRRGLPGLVARGSRRGPSRPRPRAVPGTLTRTHRNPSEETHP
ncbi:molybdenum cofactor biosynthesis enzyme MoaA [Streptomyces sp. PvR006]|nr:molybdenum cofactor biosynthesis enzyme MoaA [Streptomyces sp. PvR006]